MANDDAVKILQEILVWTRVGFHATAKQSLSEVLNTEKKRLAYQAADGTKTSTSIRVETKMSPNDVLDLFKQCTSLGLMEEVEGGKRRRLFDLTNFGLLPSAKGAKGE